MRQGDERQGDGEDERHACTPKRFSAQARRKKGQGKEETKKNNLRVTVSPVRRVLSELMD